MSEVQLVVCVATQRLWLYSETGVAERVYRVSTAEAGVGQQMGSGQTPLGRHRIRAVIGRGLPLGAVLVARRPTGEVLWPIPQEGERGETGERKDWILSRILWLCGEERGWNRLGTVDSQRRFIYLHGTAAEDRLGIPASRGCIRLRNADVVELAMVVRPGTRVWIVPEWNERQKKPR
ncbi:MAG: L,D-transpeptidase [Hydrogenophilus sp.]|nr:L,D-transpeptidase [Hydrogenophilus sp.]